MQIYKRSEITPETIDQWKKEAQQEIIELVAPSAFDLSMMISEREDGGKVKLCKNGEYYIDGIFEGFWKKMGDMYVTYKPAIGNPANVIRGPW